MLYRAAVGSLAESSGVRNRKTKGRGTRRGLLTSYRLPQAYGVLSAAQAKANCWIVSGTVRIEDNMLP
jgi:hypothetical protein